jgi:hypothetical protein
MKFTRYLAPNSLGLFNLRIAIHHSPCRHCGCRESVVAHGCLRGLAETGHETVTRGLRFFCSNRYSNIGCGRTFSVYWDTILPHASLRSTQLVALIRACASTPTRHGAWQASLPVLSLTGAYRWIFKWHRATHLLRTWLNLMCDPPIKTDGLPDPFSLRHLDAAFPACTCPAAAFQNRFQIPVWR